MSPTSTPSAAATTAVREVVDRNLATVEPDATLQDVAEELALDEIGVVVVQHGHEPIGLISERDLVTVLASGGDLETQATDLMTVDLVTAGEDTSVADVGRLMVDARVRHVLVRGPGERDDPDNGPVTGIVSMRDVVRFLLDDLG
ncbi:cyclic nucleotide-binding/CBS domain-containing protein [Actinomycetospora cinnamomea]|uniref:CBS domain protein n=1 Tax=Actinomycetospora cinnamomea TaxID=663609 RepID=A0A2U1F2A6_9PSEU|nr:CBS domain-containing protein [Actinomycetospora cinnamomea]PVZ06315.1 CBS domain protein [Actinomycetospora cinnamomea]